MLIQERLLAAKDRKILFRDNTLLMILAIFFIMSIVSTCIGWSSQHTITKVYDATASELRSIGKPVPDPPFSSTSPLSAIKNMIIYVVLIGALLSIVLGHIISINDRKAGTTRILFSRLSSKKAFFLGKAISCIQVLMVALSLSFLVSAASLMVLGVFSLQTLGMLIFFYAGSSIYLGGFAFLGMYFGLRTDRSTKAILAPLLIWVVITFALPELGSALYPTSSLNPVLPSTNVLDSPVLSGIHNVVYPFSISEQFKDFGTDALGLTASSLPTNVSAYPLDLHLLILLSWFCIIFGLTAYAAVKYDASEGDNYG